MSKLRKKYIIIMLAIIALLIFIPNIAKANVDVKRTILSNDGRMQFVFTGITLDDQQEYEYGLTKAKAESITTWHALTDFSNTSATLIIDGSTKDFKAVIDTADKGYITIRKKETDSEKIVTAQEVDLKMPFFNVISETLIKNGKEYGNGASECISVPLRNATTSNAYYQYEKITDQNVIKKYQEIKSKGGNVTELQSLLKTTPPSSGWKAWTYFNGYGADGRDGFGKPESPISVPDTGLYYMWVYFSGDNLKQLYGYAIVDNLEQDIALESISLPKTETVEMGKTLTIRATFKPEKATNKILTWSSSNPDVATVDNAGKVTPKKIGSTVITAVSDDGNKTATCTVTVVKAGSSSNGSGSAGNKTGGSASGASGSASGANGSAAGDQTTAKENLPHTGVNVWIISTTIFVAIIATVAYIKCQKVKDVK